MKICMITTMTPASENIRGTSALPYHLIKDSPDHDFNIYTFNNNQLSDEKIHEVEQELGATIKKVPLPKWYRWMFKLHLLFLRVFLKYPFLNYIKLPEPLVEEVKAQKPDLVWVMGEELSRIVKQFPGHQRIQTGPDTESLYYYRMMGQRFVMKDATNYWKCALMYRKYARMERAFCTDDNFTYYAVGEEDVRHLQQLNPKVRAKFLRHPHYEVKEERGERREERKFHRPKIKVLIAGQYNLYMRQEADLLNSQFIIHNSELMGYYSFTFLGKGWEKHVESMRKAGYEVEHITFAPDYIEEICKHDIQITPIAIGTGTKGKVLDALANGLLVIGTPYAMENIAVKHGESCIVYEKPQEVIEVLVNIVNGNFNGNDNGNVNDNDNGNFNGIFGKYERMAALGQQEVLKWHDRKRIAKELFGN